MVSLSLSISRLTDMRGGPDTVVVGGRVASRFAGLSVERVVAMERP